jgi:hypothetical protein
MKKKIAISALIAVLAYAALNIFVSDARADVYVKVDANGNAVGGSIMCDAGTCGAGSEYSRLTLQPGESYALQGTGQAGIGNNNPNTQVKVDLQTNQWTVTREVLVIPVEPVVINNQPVLSYTTQTVEKFTPATSPGNDRPAPTLVVNPTPIVISTDSATATAKTDTNTATTDTATANLLMATVSIDYLTIDWETVDIYNFDWDSFWAWLTERLWALKP